ncbi:uncharacterized protein BYT42DRAFT_555791 [Radiomyces spectabilis]|uniref:uncharacterized protein n=1 Tax=Radiomyces spectabilis TaxID=64574 RepID=UPI002220674D|nr:uncharacterized protein BYT42DRAFT_555791 [Radiomyces spectabilis]KAI8391147.1 hypothetical protein BYT42DRAFT_555791 [Radiomyces spectabilis]
MNQQDNVTVDTRESVDTWYFHRMNETDLAAEEAYFAHYDQEILDTIAVADYEDGCMQNDYDDEIMNDNEYVLNDHYDDAEHDYCSDSLLNLVLDVQSYLEEACHAGFVKTDSPLLELQYKMHLYFEATRLRSWSQ